MISKSIHANNNYLASVVKLQNIRKHSNADRLQCISIYGNNVITGLTAKENDLYIYFPVESALSTDFLKYTNSFREAQNNSDISKKGMFETNCRIKAIRLRGEKSEGYVVPASQVEEFCKNFLGKEIVFSEKHIGNDFDTIFDHLLIKKYVPANQRRRQSSENNNTNLKKKKESRLVEKQFHLHPDTEHLKRQVNKISPDDYISITNKLHGCNFVVGNVLVKRKLSFLDKVAKFFGAKVVETEYGMVYSSRNVIKNANFSQSNNHFYDADIWKIVADKIYPSLREGLSVSGEIVGYTPSNRHIQKNYDYGCNPGELDFWIFNVTYTSPCGNVYTFSHPELIDFCHKFGFKTPETYYYGKAKDLFPELNLEHFWHDEFLKKMMEKYLEKKCHLCKNDVWAEGIILRKQVPFEWEAYKLKSFNFLLGESAQLDSGEIDLDSQESVENDETAE